MEIKVSARHMDVTTPIKEYASTKTAKLPRYFDRVQSIDVILNKSGDQFSVELLVDAERTDSFVVHVHGQDMYACIDDAVQKMERQLTDHKEKLRNRKHPM